MDSFGLYVVHVRYDDASMTPDHYVTDERVAPGDIVYAKHGRAIVRSCRLNQSVDNTFTQHARILAALDRGRMVGDRRHVQGDFLDRLDMQNRARRRDDA